MKYGIFHLSIVPVRLEAADTSEMVTQALYGESFKLLEQRKKWSRIRLDDDHYEGWVDNKQFMEVDVTTYQLLQEKKPVYTSDLIDFVTSEENLLISIPMGSVVSNCNPLGHTFEGHQISGQHPKKQLVDTALLYLNAPYMWGGKAPFGIDCSGFTQMVYKLNGHMLKRDASEQATQGEALSFIEESEPGDLAFFDNAEGHIIHVGIIMEDHYIIHAHGKVRIDRIDHSGIFNVEKNTHTHKLRVIKKII